jgi:hypothetical protein
LQNLLLIRTLACITPESGRKENTNEQQKMLVQLKRAKIVFFGRILVSRLRVHGYHPTKRAQTLREFHVDNAQKSGFEFSRPDFLHTISKTAPVDKRAF